MTTTYDIELRTGDTYDGALISLAVNAAPVNLTGATLKMSVRRQDVEVYSMQLGTGLTVMDAANGLFRIDPQIISWTPGLYLYGIRVTLSSGVKKTYVVGSITVEL